MKRAIIAHIHPSGSNVSALASLMLGIERETPPDKPLKLTVMKRRKPMGSHPNIDFDKFPKQTVDPDKFGPIGSRANVCFNYDSSKTIGGTIIRNDEEEPGEMIFQLDDGRVVRSVECMWQPGKDEAPHGWVCYNSGPGAIFWSATRASLVHELSDDIRPATAYEKTLFERFGAKTSQGYMVEPNEAIRQSGDSSPAAAHAETPAHSDGCDHADAGSCGSDGGGD